MPRGRNKTTVTPPTIRQRAQEEEGVFIPDEPRVKMEDAETFQVEGNAMTGPMVGPVTVPDPKVNEEQKAKTLPDEWHLRPITTLHLTRHGDIITDSAYIVRIPAPANVKDGERVAVAIYRTKGDKWEIVSSE